MRDSFEIGQEVPPSIREIELEEEQGSRLNFGKLLGEQVTVLVLLRHFGCIACSEHVSEWVPRLAEFEKMGARVVFVGNGKADYLTDFIERHKLGDKPVTVLSNSGLEFYDALGCVRSMGSNLNFRAMKNVLGAFAQGHTQVSVEGNPQQQGGTFVMDAEGVLRFAHREQALGDHVSVATVFAETLKALGRKEVL